MALIVIGVAPFMMRDVAGHIGALPREQVVKALTLGANSWGVILRVALPQALPRLFEALRRIFLVRRYLAMDVIIPYVAWIALLAVLMDLALTFGSRRLFGWAHLGAR